MQCGHGICCNAKVRHKVEADSRDTADDTELQCVVEHSIDEGGSVGSCLQLHHVQSVMIVDGLLP